MQDRALRSVCLIDKRLRGGVVAATKFLDEDDGSCFRVSRKGDRTVKRLRLEVGPAISSIRFVCSALLYCTVLCSLVVACRLIAALLSAGEKRSWFVSAADSHYQEVVRMCRRPTPRFQGTLSASSSAVAGDLCMN